MLKQRATGRDSHHSAHLRDSVARMRSVRAAGAFKLTSHRRTRCRVRTTAARRQGRGPECFSLRSLLSHCKHYTGVGGRPGLIRASNLTLLVAKLRRPELVTS